MDGGEEGAVEPPATLRDEVVDRVGHVRHALGRLNVVQVPVGVALRDELPTEDAVLGQVCRASGRSAGEADV